jgi:hypothetical protein
MGLPFVVVKIVVKDRAGIPAWGGCTTIFTTDAEHRRVARFCGPTSGGETDVSHHGRNTRDPPAVAETVGGP